jgi:hypothetical protein
MNTYGKQVIKDDLVTSFIVVIMYISYCKIIEGDTHRFGI